MRLLQHAGIDGNIGKRAGPVAYAAGLALKRQAQDLIDDGVSHFDVIEDGLKFFLYRLNGAGRAGIAALHAQNAALLTGRNERCVRGAQAVAQIEKLNASVGTNLSAFAAPDATAQEFILSQSARRAQVSTRCRTRCSGAHKTGQETQKGPATGSFQKASSLHSDQSVRVNAAVYML